MVRLKRAFRWFKYGLHDCDYDYNSICDVTIIKMKDVLAKMIKYRHKVEIEEQIKQLGRSIFYLQYWSNFSAVRYASRIIEGKLGKLQSNILEMKEGPVKVWYENEDMFSRDEQRSIEIEAYERGERREEELRDKFLKSFTHLKEWWV